MAWALSLSNGSKICAGMEHLASKRPGASPVVPVGVSHALSSESSSSSPWSQVVSSTSTWHGASDRDSDVRVPCRTPQVLNGVVLGCGACLACRARQAKIWGNRIALEMGLYSENLFITLTYSDEHLPAEGSLHRKQLRAFIKRFRRRLEYHLGARCRYFACGEYGTKTGRPHYHAVLFGVGTWAASVVSECWPYGFTHSLAADRGAGPYVAGYMVKKLNVIDRAPREPEFVTMSDKPGIGAAVADRISEECALGYGLDEYGDVPGFIFSGKFKVALGSYLRRRIRNSVYGSPVAPISKSRAYAEKVLRVYEGAVENGKKATFSNHVRAAQIEQKFLKGRQNETF